MNIAPMSLRVARAERDSAAAAAASRATLELVKVVAATVGVTADQVARILDTVTAPADDDVDPATAGGAA